MSDVQLLERLRRAARFWRVAAIISWIGILLGVLGAGAVFWVQREQALRAVEAEARARVEAERALEETGKKQAQAEEELTRAKDQARRLLYAQQIALAQRQFEAAKPQKTLELLKEAKKKE